MLRHYLYNSLVLISKKDHQSKENHLRNDKGYDYDFFKKNIDFFTVILFAYERRASVLSSLKYYILFCIDGIPIPFE